MRATGPVSHMATRTRTSSGVAKQRASFAKKGASPARRSGSPAKQSARPATQRASPAKQRRASLPPAAQKEASFDDLPPAFDDENGDLSPLAFYCERRPKPLLRGQLHALTALTAPLWGGYQLSLCRSPNALVATTISVLSSTWLFSASGIFHRYAWTHRRQEALFGKLDYIGIFLQVAFSIAPFYVLLLPILAGWCVVIGLGITVAAGTLIVLFDPPWARSRHVLVSIYTAQAMLQIVPLTSRLFAPLSIWSQLSLTECYLFLLTIVSYGVGAQCYAHGVPRLWPSVFGFHELWHVLVVCGHLGTYAANCCLMLRIA